MSADGTNWLPPEDGESRDRTGGNYFKPAKDGTPAKLRVLSQPIAGEVRWTDSNKPVRKRVRDAWPEGQKWRVENGKEDRGRYFWALAVWNYAEKRVQVWEVTQATVQAAIRELTQNEDFGAPTGYDITVKRKGEGKDTEYSCIASPPKPIAPAVAEAWANVAASGFDLTRLYGGGDPFSAPPGGVDEEDGLPF